LKLLPQHVAVPFQGKVFGTRELERDIQNHIERNRWRINGLRQRNHTTQNLKKNKALVLIIDNVIYAPDCPIRLIRPQQLHRQSKAQGDNASHFVTEENMATLFHGGDIITCDYHMKKNTYGQLHPTIKR
jgi:hypothetical protein